MEVVFASLPMELFTKVNGAKVTHKAKAFCSALQMKSSRAVLKAGNYKTEVLRFFSQTENSMKAT